MSSTQKTRDRFETAPVGPHFQVPVVLYAKSRSIPVRLLLDTGATKVVIPTWVVNHLGLQRAEEEVVETAMGSMRLGTTTVPRIQVRGSGLEAKDVPAWVGNNLLLGMSFLRRFRFWVDHGRKLTIEK